jgi:ferredoxin-type protein NapH
MTKQRRNSILRTIIEIAAVALFVILFMKHKLQLWIIIFGLSVVLSVFLGRFYCSWICPMKTSFRLTNLIYSKLNVKRFRAPSFFKKSVFRYCIMILFLGSMIVIKKMGLKQNPLLYITLFSIFLTLFFEETFWHRHLCPLGTILSRSSGKAFHRLAIDEESCIECGKCQLTCPSSSIMTTENGKRRNLSSECLLCGNCVDACPTKVCQFEWGRGQKKQAESI